MGHSDWILTYLLLITHTKLEEYFNLLSTSQTSDILTGILGEGYVLGVNDRTPRFVMPASLLRVWMDIRRVLTGDKYSLVLSGRFNSECLVLGPWMCRYAGV